MNRLDANEIAQRTPREKKREACGLPVRWLVSFNQRTKAGFLAFFEFVRQGQIRD